MDGTQPTTSDKATSWRDVYQLVQDTEGRLTRVISDGFARQEAVTQDHEVRIRVLENTDVVAAVQRRTLSKSVDVGRVTLLAIMSIGSMVVAVISIMKP